MSRDDIRDRIVIDPDGCICLLPEGAEAGPVAMWRGQPIRTTTDSAAFSAAAATTKRPAKPTPSAGVASTLCTRAEAAQILGLTPEQTAAVLSENEVLTGLGFDRRHVELLAKAIRKGERTGSIEVPVGLRLDPVPE